MELTLRTLPRVLHKTQTVICRRISLCHTCLFQNRVNEKSLVAARLSTKSDIVAERTLFQMLPVVYWQTNRHMAGHSKFSNIKHRKKAQDSKKSALMGQYVKLAQSAVKMGGSTDPKLNPKLAQVIESAKKSSLQGILYVTPDPERPNLDPEEIAIECEVEDATKETNEDGQEVIKELSPLLKINNGA
ncbi:probable transcriptional regulatory protein PERMA_0079 [Crassostrea angulata]|uniref:probable transcriptional regulatory protein PERMA_0079 n=1 Tax=Magallana angulata TaxID=2784310 RepID=UPI0022B0E2E1|nr:probable transcriptional regulatory protein PERMA_0079 [Crassostrea angulata]